MWLVGKHQVFVQVGHMGAVYTCLSLDHARLVATTRMHEINQTRALCSEELG
jgi:hypothetical protein